MTLTIVIIAACISFGAFAAFAARGPIKLPDLTRTFTRKDLQRFSPKKTLFLIGPSVNHGPCKLQRRLLKPAIAALICEDVAVMEVYGDETPRKNGAPVEWLDPALLRHAMDAEEGFFVIYVNEDGKTLFRSEAPMVTSELLRRSELNITPAAGAKRKKSLVLKKLKAA